LNERRNEVLQQGIVFVPRREHAYATHPHRLLRARGERPRRRAAQPSDEFAPSKENAHLALRCREPYEKKNSTAQAVSPLLAPALAARMARQMTKTEIQEQALANARAGQSVMNYSAIFQGFMAKGIADSDIKPRENVFTFHAWKALGRSVKRGEHGVKVVTFIPCETAVRDPQTGEEKTEGYRRPHTTTVFHISQTEPTSEREARFAGTARRGYRNADRDPGYVDPGELAEDRWNEQQSRHWR
jgi:hypothetical protein